MWTTAAAQLAFFRAASSGTDDDEGAAYRWVGSAPAARTGPRWPAGWSTSPSGSLPSGSSPGSCPGCSAGSSGASPQARRLGGVGPDPRARDRAPNVLITPRSPACARRPGPRRSATSQERVVGRDLPVRRRLHAGRPGAEPRAADRRCRHRRCRPRLRRPEPGEGLPLGHLHADRGPVRRGRRDRLGEAVGTVEAVTLRTTRLRDVNGTVWHVPNGEILPGRQQVPAVGPGAARHPGRARHRRRPRPARCSRRWPTR